MTDRAIIVDEISKFYHIGSAKNSYETLRDRLASCASAPFKRIGKLIKGQWHGASACDETMWALKDVSFEIKHGEAVAIIGNNGAGKSTLLKILSRITKPSSGRASIYGRLGSLLEVGTGFHPELTGRENIFFNGSILGMKKHEIKMNFDQIVEFAGIEKFLDTPVKHYSSGMYVRLAFSVAAHLNPEILVIDEVLAVGDVAFQKKCLGKMEDVSKSGRTVIFVSHNMQAVKNLCDRALLLENGVIEKEGNVDEVIHHYLEGLQSTPSTRSWTEIERPGNKEIKIESVAVKNQNNGSPDHISLSEPFFIEITFEASSKSKAIFALTFLTEDGICTFSSLSNLEENHHGSHLEKGIYSTRCTVPANLLNNGRYFVSVKGFSANWSDAFSIDRPISFEAVDDGSNRGDYFGPYGGTVRPKLHWSTNRLASA